MPAFELAAVAEPVAEARETVAAETGAKGFADLPSMLRGRALDAVYIATPTELHPEHAALAFAAKKHVLTEKPMAIRIEQAQAMIDGRRPRRRRAAGRPFAQLRPADHSACARSWRRGALGRVRMIHTWNFTDWIYRPRRPDELDIALGGGVTFRQGSHQFDIIRLLGGGLVKSVHATTFDWDAARRSIGAHTVFMQFADGAAATAVYNGYGYFSTMELIADVAEWGFTEPLEKRAPVRRSAALTRRAGAGGQAQARRQRDPGERAASAALRPDAGELRARRHPAIAGRAVRLFGQGPRGDRAAERRSPRDLVLDEFAAAIAGKARDPRRPLGPRQSGSLPRRDRVVEERQGDRAETSGCHLDQRSEAGAASHASHQAGRRRDGPHAAHARRRRRRDRAHRRGRRPADPASRRMPRADDAGPSGRSAGRSGAAAPERQPAVARQGRAATASAIQFATQHPGLGWTAMWLSRAQVEDLMTSIEFELVKIPESGSEHAARARSRTAAF